MHQSKKGNDWHLGLKAHMGVDLATGLVHTLVVTAGNVADVTQADALLHGGEKVVIGEALLHKSSPAASESRLG